MPSKPVFLSTFVFLDLETTGLPSIAFKPEITELCMIAVSRFAVEDPSTNVRVQNKLTMCFHPSRSMHPIASKVSGLDEKNLFYQKDFDAGAVQLIQHFISRLDPPVCLVAHNGFRFDFPLLRAELARSSGTNFELFDHDGAAVNCADTLPMFRVLNSQLEPANTSNDSGFLSQTDQSTDSIGHPIAPLSHSSPKKSCPKDPISFSLGDIYRRVFGSTHSEAHHAEGDCKAMLHLVQHLGLSAVDWLQTNCVDLTTIPPMYVVQPADDSVAPSDEFPYKRNARRMASKCLDDTTCQLDKVHLNN